MHKTFSKNLQVFQSTGIFLFERAAIFEGLVLSIKNPTKTRATILDAGARPFVSRSFLLGGVGCKLFFFLIYRREGQLYQTKQRFCYTFLKAGAFLQYICITKSLKGHKGKVSSRQLFFFLAYIIDALRSETTAFYTQEKGQTDRKE